MRETDNEKLELYIRKFHGTIYRVAFGYVRNSAEAEDICQEAFIKLLSCREDFPADENCKAWLIRVTINLSKNLLRSSRITRSAELNENLPFSEPRQNELMDSVMKLPPKYRTVIILYYYEEYSVKEIADIMGATVSATTTRLSRARERLKEMLLEEGF